MAAFALAGGPVAAQGNEDADAFLAWAREEAVPFQMSATSVPPATLQALAEMIGDARIVALSEGVHGAAEPLMMRNELFKYLVRELGFTAIAIESGLAESWLVHDFVRGGVGDLDQVVEEGFSWTFHRYPENRELVAWLRAYNMSQPPVRQVDFYGFDVPGSPGNPAASRGMLAGLETAIEYLAEVDPVVAGQFRSALPDVADYTLNPRDGRGFPLPQDERDRVSALVSDLVSLLRRNEVRYSAMTSEHSFRWALQTAVAAEQANDWLRRIPPGWGVDAMRAGDTRPYSEAFAVRDRAQADNLRWILREEGPRARVLVFASNAHTSASPIVPQDSLHEEGHSVAGTYLRHWFGTDYLAIANTVGSGTLGCRSSSPIPDFAEMSLPSLLSDLGHPYLLLDLRSADGQAARWLSRRQDLGLGNQVYLGDAYDIVFHVDEVSPSC